MWTGSQVLVTRATDHSVLDEWSEDGPFWIFWFLSSHSTGSLVGGCPTSAVVRELTNFRNAPLFITSVLNSLGSSFRHNFHFCPGSKCRALVPNFARLARRNYAADARLLRMCGRRDSNDWTAVVTTMNILIFSYFQIRFSDPSLREGRQWWGSKMERLLLMMKICDSSSSCGKCEKSVMTRRKFNKHHVIYHELEVQ